MTNEIVKRDWQELDLATPADMAGVMVQSGYFTDARSMSQAIVKIMAGRDLGLSSFASMNGIDVVEGHLRLRSSLLATLVKQSKGYDYRVREWDESGCRIEFFDITVAERESIGFGEFTEADRERGGLSLKTKKGYPSVWGKYPKAMMFARAMSNGVAAHCPDVTGGSRVYTEGDDFGNGTGFELPPVDATRTDALNAALEDNPLPAEAGDEPEGEDGDAGPPADASPDSEEMSAEAKEFFDES